MAGAISAVVQIAYCISFAALIFTGDLAAGFPLGLAGLIMGTVVTCVVIALTSTFSPVIGGPDSPAVAVMGVLAASIATALAAKGASTPTIIINVLVALSVSTLLTGILLYGVGALRLGQWLRFIPYPVIGGFLAASGILLITGGAEVVTQTNLSLSPSSWAVLYSSVYGPQILVGLLFAVSIPVLGRFGALRRLLHHGGLRRSGGLNRLTGAARCLGRGFGGQTRPRLGRGPALRPRTRPAALPRAGLHHVRGHPRM